MNFKSYPQGQVTIVSLREYPECHTGLVQMMVPVNHYSCFSVFVTVVIVIALWWFQVCCDIAGAVPYWSRRLPYVAVLLHSPSAFHSIRRWPRLWRLPDLLHFRYYFTSKYYSGRLHFRTFALSSRAAAGNSWNFNGWEFRAGFDLAP